METLMRPRESERLAAPYRAEVQGPALRMNDKKLDFQEL
jgi:hypothetical protein